MSERKRILVVDDERSLVLLMKVNLEFAGFEVVTAADGEEAIQRALADKPDLVLLDIGMPKKDGWEVCQDLKSRDITKNIPIIFLSAYSQKQDIERGLKMGAARYIKKPMDPLEVVRTIEEIIKPIL